jgi:molybdate transport repressor ModE-like protein
MMPLTVERLRLLHSVAAHGTIAAAAAEVGYTASAVSQQLSALERQLGTSLLERTTRGVTLTPAGARLRERAATILDLVQVATIEATQARPNAPPVEIRIGAFPSAISSIILPAIPALEQEADLTIVHLEPEQSLTELLARRLDAAVIDSYEGQRDPSQPGLNLTPLLTDPLRIALRSDRPPPRALSDLADAKWVLGGAHSRLGQATKAVLQTNGITPSILVESDDHGITFDVIGSIAAVTMLPELALRGAPPHVATVADIDLRRDRHIHLVTRMVPHPHPAFNALEAALLQVASRISTVPARAGGADG